MKRTRSLEARRCSQGYPSGGGRLGIGDQDCVALTVRYHVPRWGLLLQTSLVLSWGGECMCIYLYGYQRSRTYSAEVWNTSSYSMLVFFLKQKETNKNCSHYDSSADMLAEEGLMSAFCQEIY